MATTSELRQSNQWRIIKAMLELKRATRADLAKATNMSQPTVGRIVDDLIRTSLLQEIEDAPLTAASGLGRPSKLLSLDRHAPRFLAIQLGVRNTRISRLPAAPPEQDAWEIEIPTTPTLKEWMQSLKKAIAAKSLREFETIVISLHGIINEQTGQVLLSPNAAWTEQQRFGMILQEAFNKPVVVTQEIRALALGQYLARPDVRDFLLVDLGNGVGAAAVMNGELLRSALPISGELGHTPVVGNTRLCSCGAIGCVETLVSRGGLLASSRQHKGPSSWPAFIAQLRKQGPPGWMNASLEAVATTIAGAINMIGLRHVFITGSVEELPREIGDRLCHLVVTGAMWSRFGTVTCEVVPRHRQAGMVAAAIEQSLATEPA